MIGDYDKFHNTKSPPTNTKTIDRYHNTETYKRKSVEDVISKTSSIVVIELYSIVVVCS